jgi:hypothetical protein
VRARVAGLPSSSEVKEVLPVKEQMIVEICTR